MATASATGGVFEDDEKTVALYERVWTRAPQADEAGDVVAGPARLGAHPDKVAAAAPILDPVEKAHLDGRDDKVEVADEFAERRPEELLEGDRCGGGRRTARAECAGADQARHGRRHPGRARRPLAQPPSAGGRRVIVVTTVVITVSIINLDLDGHEPVDRPRQ